MKPFWRTLALLFVLLAGAGGLFFAWSARSRSGASSSTDHPPKVAADGFVELDDVGEAYVSSAGPLPGGGFYVAGANAAGRAWLLHVDAKGVAKQALLEEGYLGDAVALADGGFGVVGWGDRRAFLATIGPAGEMSDAASFPGHRGSEVAAIVRDHGRLIGVGTDNPPVVGRTDGWLLATGDGMTWSQLALGVAHRYLVDVAISGETVFAGGGESADGENVPLQIRCALDGGAVSDPKSPATWGSYGAVVAQGDGVAFVGGLAFGEIFPKLTVEFYGQSGELRQRLRSIDDQSPDMIGRAIAIATADAIAFTTAWGPVETSQGALVVVAKDGRWSTTPIEGRGKVSMRRAANVVLRLEGSEATFLRLRNAPTFGYRVDHMTIRPFGASVEVDAGPSR